MAPNTENVEKDWTVLVKLLPEYTTSLQKIIQERERLAFKGLLSALIGSLGFAAVLLGLREVIPILTWTTSLTVAIPLCIIMVGGVVTAFLWTFGNTRKVINEEIEVLARKLHKMVRLASQLDEHSNALFDVRLELDLRLIEAEAALRKAARVARFDSRNDEKWP